MVLAGRYRAVLDRFHDGVAVLVLFSDGDPVDELAVDRSELPADHRRVDAVFRVRLAAGRITSLDPVDDPER